MPHLHLRLLGGFDVQVSGQSGVPLTAKKAQALLAYLALHPDQDQPREKLAALFWGETADEFARTNLRQSLAVLRKALAHNQCPSVLNAGKALHFDAGQAEIDVMRFEQCCDQATPGALEEALALYQGELLEGFAFDGQAFEDWLAGERRRLQERQLQALNTLLAHYWDSAQHERAIDIAGKLLALDPLQEPVHRTLMQCYHAEGRRRAVLQQYQSLREILQQELGLKPDAETEQLYRQLLSLPRDQDEDATAAGPPEHKLAAILHAGVADFNRLSHENEAEAYRILRESLSAIAAAVADHRGRVANIAGDSALAELPSPVEAVRAALEIQTQLEQRNTGLAKTQRMRFRIGIDLGDIIAEGDHLLGDTVNVAACLQELARPGGLCVSAAVFEQVRDRLDLNFTDLGEHTVKNSIRPVRAYRVALASEYQPLSPFRGLAVFDIEHAGFFYGRSDAIAAAKNRLERQAAAGQAFLLIYGMSGVGKSSLARAGLLPALTRSGPVPEIDTWRYAIMHPAEASSPLAALAAALLADAALPELSASHTAAGLEQGFHQTPDSTLQLLRGALDQITSRRPSESNPGQSMQARLLLLVDQLEELFTAEQIDNTGRAEFVRVIKLLAGSGFIWVSATLRSDFFHRCAEIPGLSELKDGLGSYELLPPTAAEIGEIIRQPAQAAGLRFEEDPRQGHLDEVLQQAAARDPASLPLLEFTLDSLYEAGKSVRLLRFADYHALGGLEGAIARRADEIVANLPEKVQAALPAVLRALVTVKLGEASVTARTAALAELAATPERQALIDALIGARLVVSSTGSGGPVLRLAHEALLSHWPRAQKIIAADRAFLETRARVQTDQQRWQNENRNPELLLPPGRRLGEAEELLAGRREELDQALAGYIEASLAASQRVARQTLKRTRRFAIAMAILALLAGIGGYFGYSGQHAAELRLVEVGNEKARAERQTNLAEQRAAQFRVVSVVSNVVSAVSDPGTQALLLAQLQGSREPPNGVEVARRVLNQPIPRSVLRAHESIVMGVVFSPDGTRLASAGRDGTVRVWAADGRGEPLVLRGHKDAVTDVVFSPDGTRLASAGRDGTVRVWAADARGEPLVLRAHNGVVASVAFSPDGTRLASAGHDGAVRIQAADGRGEALVFQGHDGRVASVAFSPDGTRLASAGSDRIIRVWALDGSGEPLILQGHEGWVASVVFSPDGTRLASAGRDGAVRVWAAGGSDDESLVLRGHEGWVASVVFSPDGTRLASASRDGTVRVWPLDDSGEPLVLQKHGGPLTDVAFSPDGTRLASAGDDRIVRVWALDGRGEPLIFQNDKGWVTDVAFSPDGARLASASRNKTVRVWALDGSSEALVFQEHTGPVLSVAFSPDGTRLASAGHDRIVRVWRLDGSGGRLAFAGHKGDVASIVFSPDGSRLASAGRDSTVRVWALDGSGEPLVLQDHEGPVTSVAFSPDGSRLAGAGHDGTVRLRAADGGGELLVLHGHEGWVESVAFSPDGARLASAGHDGTVRIWAADGRGKPLVLQGHAGPVTSVAFSPDGARLASAGIDNTVRIWFADGRGKPRVLRGHKDQVWSVAFSPDGTRLASASDDDTVRVWATRWEDLLARLASSTTACLTPRQRVEFLYDSPQIAREAYESCERRHARIPLPNELLE